MSEETKLSMVTIQLRGSHTKYEVLVSQEVARGEFKAALLSLLSDLSDTGVEPVRLSGEHEQHKRKSETEIEHPDDPHNRLARELDVSAEQVKRIVGIKGESIQLYKASQFKIADAVCFICFAYEKALGHPSMPYEVLTRLLEASQIKMKTPASVMCFNMINDGYFQKRPYDEARNIVLESKGEGKARDFAKQLADGSYRAKETSGSVKKRTPKPSRK